MSDPRIEQYAQLLLDRCLTIESGHQVLVIGSPLGRPLLEEIVRQLARKGAYALLRVTFSGGPVDLSWQLEAPMAVLAEPAPIELETMQRVDAVIAVVAPENTKEPSALSHERQAAMQAAYRPGWERMLSGELQWVGCQYPVPALAQEAGMSASEFEDFLYGACLLDWDAEHERMRRYADLFDAAEDVRIVGDGTDLRLRLAGRPAKVDAGGANMPGGEFFFSPVEDSAEGEISFSEFVASFGGRDIPNVHLRFEGGRVIDATADANEDYLLQVLDSDDGARRVGELGIGCNPGITRYMKNTLFDEKIDGTVHIALGNGFPYLGGTNVSRIHWDIVKDLRKPGSRIELDGEVVQRDGAWLVPPA
jgi:aminopeptidase